MIDSDFYSSFKPALRVDTLHDPCIYDNLFLRLAQAIKTSVTLSMKVKDAQDVEEAASCIS